MDHDLGYFDDETFRLEPLAKPLRVESVIHVSDMKRNLCVRNGPVPKRRATRDKCAPSLSGPIRQLVQGKKQLRYLVIVSDMPRLEAGVSNPMGKYMARSQYIAQQVAMPLVRESNDRPEGCGRTGPEGG